VNCVLDLRDGQPALAASLDPAENESFDAWRDRAAAILRAYFCEFEPDPLASTLPILATADGAAVSRAAAAANLSERQYRRVFAHYYGVSPKLYQRAVRVDRMLRQLHDAPWEADHYDETPIAFADQPHATREFRSMTGLSPSEYVRSKRDGGLTLRSAPTADVEPPRF
jgi:AraC-like DNA-binding protein